MSDSRKSNKKLVTILIIVSLLLIVVPFIALKGAEFGGSDDAGSQMVNEVTGKDFVKDPGLHRTMLGDGLACIVAGLIGGPPVTTYSEVTGAISLTKITDPAVIRIAAVSGIVFSVFGKISALLKSIPAAVLGGIMLLLFGTIAAVGINSLIQNRTNLGDTRNLIIVSLILTFGIGGAAIEFGGFTMAGIGLSALLGVVLNLVLPRSKTLP